MDRPALTRLDDCPAPAKLNLFLHVVGRRPDGYHLLQSAFRLIELADSLSFGIRHDGLLRRTNIVEGVPERDDLVVRAGALLQAETGCRLGADIRVDKRIPMGAGLGGGSSDAATTLLALNRLWQTGLDRKTLASLGLRLGADIPFFIFGRDAFAQGIGEDLQPLVLEPAFYVLLSPGVSIPTREIFAAKELTRDSEAIKITDFAMSTCRNDLQPVACSRYPAVQDAIDWLSQQAPARMTGSGSCIFAQVASESEASRIIEHCPSKWRAWKTRSISCHPLLDWV
ncbi:MAG: 4-(cytidine 5'-diphospho)-2-C-methyl-D-erythritol kinase [Zoogloeaceae bacterium]|nr:4-(cytidine 5'-diphospho)-2-C-methyl-D-erythritol kinase [Zoogloeaceae bacterium]